MMKVHRWVAAIALAAVTSSTTGCFGSFRLVQKVYGLNQHVGNKWVQTIVFWVFCILPVYSLAAFADAIIFNLLEFWTGRNPLSMNDVDSPQRVVEADGHKLAMTFEGSNTLRLEVTTATGTQVFRLISTDEGGALVDAQGKVLTQTGLDDQGNLVVRDGAGALLTERSGAQLADLLRAAEAGPAALMASSALSPCQVASR